jgi:hypothetical protein
MRVLETGHEVDLAEEPLRAQRGGQLRPEDLDRDIAAVLPVVGAVDVGHAPVPDLTIEFITVRKRGPEAVDLIHHGGAHARP